MHSYSYHALCGIAVERLQSNDTRSEAMGYYRYEA